MGVFNFNYFYYFIPFYRDSNRNWKEWCKRLFSYAYMSYCINENNRLQIGTRIRCSFTLFPPHIPPVPSLCFYPHFHWTETTVFRISVIEKLYFDFYSYFLLKDSHISFVDIRVEFFKCTVGIQMFSVIIFCTLYWMRIFEIISPFGSSKKKIFFSWKWILLWHFRKAAKILNIIFNFEKFYANKCKYLIDFLTITQKRREMNEKKSF